MIDRYATDEMKRLWSETHRFATWLEVELAATEAWERLGQVPPGTVARIRDKLGRSPIDDVFARRVAELERLTRHDVVAFTRALAERIGEEARYIHIGLTSTDVVDSAQNLILRDALTIILDDVTTLVGVLRARAAEHKHTPSVGRTHGVHAEPLTFGLKLLNFYAAAERDLTRLADAKAAVSVAMLSGSVGTYAHVPPEIEQAVAGQLGLTADVITNQAVARDRHAQVMSALAILGTTLERIAVEVRHLQRTEVNEVEEGFAAGQTGSSSMPHKKNPIASENVTGIARLLRSNAQAALENVALWHERDISHSSVERVILPDSTTLASYATRRLVNVLENLVVHQDNMKRNLDALHGLIYSQRVLHQLIDKRLSREQAYEIVQRNSLTSWETRTSLRELLEKDPDCALSAGELDDAFSAEWYLRYVDDIFARFGL